MHHSGDKRVRDLMTRGVITVDFQAPLSEAIEALVRNGVTGVVAVDGKGEAMGIVSSIDIIRALTKGSKEAIAALKVEDIMTPALATVQPGKYLREAAQIMADKKVHRLIIVSPNRGCKRPVGIISATDIIKELYNDLKS